MEAHNLKVEYAPTVSHRVDGVTKAMTPTKFLAAGETMGLVEIIITVAFLSQLSACVQHCSCSPKQTCSLLTVLIIPRNFQIAVLHYGFA